MPQNAANLLMDAMGEGSGNGDKGVEAAMATTTITVPDNIMICATTRSVYGFRVLPCLPLCCENTFMIGNPASK